MKRLIEMCRHVHGLLSGRGIQHQQCFLGLDQVAQPNQLLHQILVDLQSARGVENQRVAVLGARGGERVPGDLQNVLFTLGDKHRQLDLLSQLLELIHGRRTIHIGRHQQRGAALLEQQAAEFAARGRLA